MSAQEYVALTVEKGEEGVRRSIGSRTIADLPEGDVLIRVEYSSLNYKDALSATGHPGVTKRFPHTPGIDAAGTVAESNDPDLPVGTEVLAFGYDLGMNTPGGFGQYIRVPREWVVALPPGFSTHEAMVYGTAGFTAAYSVQKLESSGVAPNRGEILVTGASGGVGSMAVAMLAARGYTVTAMSGKEEARELLERLGASNIVPRTTDNDVSKRPLDSSRWAGVIDTVGGAPLSQALKEVHYDGAVTCCGLVASPELNITVYPFILRDVSLIGVDSVNCTQEERYEVWNKIAGEWRLSADRLEAISQDVPLEEIDSKIDAILAGKLLGRTVVVLP